ncbi:hypothetical protein HOK021_41100 [Streptomyces hygroscopicus]|nr:hypothetical protein HOK021_41100 [Streptomyces hygroscopicus]
MHTSPEAANRGSARTAPGPPRGNPHDAGRRDGVVGVCCADRRSGSAAGRLGAGKDVMTEGDAAGADAAVHGRARDVGDEGVDEGLSYTRVRVAGPQTTETTPWDAEVLRSLMLTL